MPAELARMVRTWRFMHPEWSHHLWTEAELVPEFHRDPWVRDFVAQSCHLAQRANVYRFLLLRKYGGVYVDTDFECWRPMSDVFESPDGAAIVGLSKPGILCPALIAMPMGHSLADALVAEMFKRDPKVSRTLDSHLLTQVVLAHQGNPVRILPSDAIYPLGSVNWEHARIAQSAEFPLAYAVHRWSSFWWSPSFAPLGGGQ